MNEHAVDTENSFSPTEKSSMDQDAIEGDTANSAADTTVSFVDYTPPLAAQIQPPAKHKLFLMILVMVYFAVWFADEAGFFSFLTFHGWLSPEAALFLSLCCIVFVLTYATLDLVVACTTYQNPTTGKLYGLGAWFKAPRRSQYWSNNSNNVLGDILANVLSILEDGFEMFHAPEEHHHQPPTKPFTCPDASCAKTLKIEHRIDLHKVNEYKLWLEKIGHLAKRHAHGPIHTQRSQLDHLDGVLDEVDEQRGNNAQTAERDIELGEVTSTPGAKNSQEGIFHSVTLTFSNVYSLNEWMMSSERKVLMEELRPMLVVPDVVQIQLNRKLPDAFSDLLTRQGQSVPTLPPQKWKVWWMTVLALYLSIKWVNHFFPYYHHKWGLPNHHDRLQALISDIITVFFVSYIMNPLLLFVFHPWMKRKEKSGANDNNSNNREPWKTLNDGFQSIWWKAFWTFALYGGCLITWAVKE